MTTPTALHLAGLAAEVSAEMRGALAACAHAPKLQGMLEYHLGWRDQGLAPVNAPSGKRVRPMLCLLAASAAGGDYRLALPAAAALELVHNFSLIHDDIQDRSPERRHRRTVWAIWGDAQGIDAGDAMLVIAQLALLRTAALGVQAETVVRAAVALNLACLRLAEGQHLDIDFEGRVDVNSDDYLTMIAGKTGALLGCSLELGAIVAGADAETAGRYRQVGEELGLAFQIEDDRLGIWGDPAKTGKPHADDVRQRKMTLAVIRALAQAGPTDAAIIRRVYSGGPPTESEVAAVVAALDRSDAKAGLDADARKHHERALALLDEAGPAEPAGTEIRKLARALMGRDR